MKTLFLIGGPMGVGKTTVCRHLKQTLSGSVFLDGDRCWDANPFLVNEETKAMVLDNICHLLNNFLRCAAYETVIFCWVMHEQRIIDTILSRLDTGNCVVKCVSLTADSASLRNRIMADIAQGTRAPDALDRSLARLPLYAGLSTIQIDTTGKSAEEVCREIAGLRPV